MLLSEVRAKLAEYDAVQAGSSAFKRLFRLLSSEIQPIRLLRDFIDAHTQGDADPEVTFKAFSEYCQSLDVEFSGKDIFALDETQYKLFLPWLVDDSLVPMRQRLAVSVDNMAQSVANMAESLAATQPLQLEPISLELVQFNLPEDLVRPQQPEVSPLLATLLAQYHVPTHFRPAIQVRPLGNDVECSQQVEVDGVSEERGYVIRALNP